MSAVRGARVEAVAGRGPCLVDVPADDRENLKLAELMGQLVCPV